MAELVGGVRASCLNFGASTNLYIRISGVAVGGAKSRELRLLFAVLRHMRLGRLQQHGGRGDDWSLGPDDPECHPKGATARGLRRFWTLWWRRPWI